MKVEPATTKRSCSKRSERELNIPTNHDLLREIRNRGGKCKSSLEEGFPQEKHQKSRPSLIERKHHQNLPQSFNQEVIVRVHSVNSLMGCLHRLLGEQDLLPTVKRKIRDAMEQLQSQLVSGIKRLERMVEAESNSKLNEQKLSKDLTRLQKKIDCGRQNVRKLEQDRDSLSKKVQELQKKLEIQNKSVVSTAASSNHTRSTSVHNVSVSSISDEKKLRGIVLGQSNVINQQQNTIELHREELNKAKLHSDQLYYMMLFQATTIESLLPPLNKYSHKKF